MKLPGYEFTDKKIREQFKKTEYGKRCNQYLYTSIALFVAAAIITFLGIFILCTTSKCSNTIDNFIDDYGFYYAEVMVILGVIMCYFDGRRDGAIRQFELGLKKSKVKSTDKKEKK